LTFADLIFIFKSFRICESANFCGHLKKFLVYFYPFFSNKILFVRHSSLKILKRKWVHLSANIFADFSKSPQIFCGQF